MSLTLPQTTPQPLQFARCAQTHLPDLQRLTGECPLLMLAIEAATEVAGALPRLRRPTDEGLNACALLTLLTYSYAAGLYASEDIEANCLQDPAARYLVGHSGVSAQSLRAFRRRNRPWIEQALARVLARVAGSANSPEPTLQHGAVPALEAGGWLQAARQRTQTAVLMDLELAD